MPKRRANGEGNIRKRKDGRWEGRYTVGHDPETGKAIIKNVLGKTQAEVKEKLKTAIEENIGIDYGKAKSFTVGSWLEVWMENYAKIKLRPSTFKTSQGFLKNHIKPQIGSIPLAELTSLDLQKFYKHLLEGGRVDRIEAKKKPKGLAPKTVRNIHQMICSAYNLAMEQKLVNKNPTQGCALPKVEHEEMKTLTADQLSTFFREARDSGVYELYYLDLATGLRRGELLGLKWADVDFQRGTLKIQRAISRQNGRVEEAPLKTKNAYRTLPLSADAIGVLKVQKNKTGNSEWVFPSPTGGPMSPDSVLHIRVQIRVAFRRREFQIAFAIACAYACFAFIYTLLEFRNTDISLIKDANQSVCFSQFNELWFFFSLIYPFLIVLPCATSFVEDYRNRLLPAYISRTSKRIYYLPVFWLSRSRWAH